MLTLKLLESIQGTVKMTFFVLASLGFCLPCPCILKKSRHSDHENIRAPD